MSVSAEKIISYISSAKDGLTRRELIAALKKKETADKSTDKAVDKILFALASEGFIVKSRNKYIPNIGVSGTVSVGKNGSITLLTETGCKIIIKNDRHVWLAGGDKASAVICDFRNGKFFGRIQKSLAKKRELFAAKFLRMESGTAVYELTDMPEGTEVCGSLDETHFSMQELTDRGSMYAVSLTDKILNRHPVCEVKYVLPYDDESYDLQRIKLKYGLPQAYPEIYDQAELKKRISSLKKQNRRDYRKQLIVTIDGPDSKDFDDAVSAVSEGENIRLFVHIADVSAYVNKDSRLDKEAFGRSLSHYLGEAVVPMLPEILCNDLCSLIQGKDRPTVSAEILFTPSGEVLEAGFHTGLINVNKRLTYEEAEKLILGKSKSKLCTMLRLLNSLAVVLYKKRSTEGSIDLNIADTVLRYKDGKVAGAEYAERLMSHSLIEECMLSANQAAAKLLKAAGIPALYRVHEKIDRSKIENLLKFVKLYGIRIKKNENATFLIKSLIEAVHGKEEEQVINLAILKSMMQANYASRPIGHFALGFKDYTHFTSPIRRYPDLIVHRCLKSLITASSPPYTLEQQELIGEKTSEAEQTAKKAERSMLKLKFCRLLEGHIGESFDAYISGFSSHGLYVTLKERPIEGMVPFRFLTDDYYNLKEDEFTVIGKKYAKRYKLGDGITVSLANVNREKMRIDFKPFEGKSRNTKSI